MQLEEIVIDCLQDLKIIQLNDSQELSSYLGDWSSFSNLVAKISREFKAISCAGGDITQLESNENPETFVQELVAMLSELQCPWTMLTEGSLESRFDTKSKRLQAIYFLCTELQASRLVFLRKLKQSTSNCPDSAMFTETEDSKNLLLETLGLSKALDLKNIPTMFTKIQEKTAQIQLELKANGLEGKPMFRGILTENQWQQLEIFKAEMDEDYTLRRKMMLKRLDVTAESFQWVNPNTSNNEKAAQLQARSKEVAEVFEQHRSKMASKPNVALKDFLAARDELANFESASSGSIRAHLKCAINKVVLGNVPDRGGRPNEMLPEVPQWEQRAKGSVGWIQRGGHHRQPGFPINEDEDI